MPAFLPSERPIVARVRHHWIVLFRRPSRVLLISMLVLLLAALFKPMPMAIVFAGVFGAVAFWRWQNWDAEQVILTRTRIVRVRGVPETTTTESSLRLDRISGAVLTQTVMGKLFNYGNIELESAGSHPDFRHLKTIERPHWFYMQLRKLIFSDTYIPDPDEHPEEHVTEPLPTLIPPSRHWRRR